MFYSDYITIVIMFVVRYCRIMLIMLCVSCVQFVDALWIGDDTVLHSWIISADRINLNYYQ